MAAALSGIIHQGDQDATPGNHAGNPDTDFKAEAENIQRVIDAAPEVVSHNIENR
jgi:lipoate synthase